MAGPVYDLEIEQGAEWNFNLRWIEEGEPADLTGWSALLIARGTYQGATALISMSTNPGGGIEVTMEGWVNVHLDPEDTRAIEIPKFVRPGKYGAKTLYDVGVYMLMLTSPEGEEFRFAEGRVFINPEVKP